MGAKQHAGRKSVCFRRLGSCKLVKAVRTMHAPVLAVVSVNKQKNTFKKKFTPCKMVCPK